MKRISPWYLVLLFVPRHCAEYLNKGDLSNALKILNTFLAVNNINPYGKQNRYYFRVGVVSRIASCNNQLVKEDVLVLDAARLRNKNEGATYSARLQTTIGRWYC